MGEKKRYTTNKPGYVSPIRNEKATREEVWTAINTNEYRDLIAEIGKLLAELRKNNVTSAALAKAQEALDRKMAAEHALGVGMGQYTRYQRGYTRSGLKYTQTIDTNRYYSAIKNNPALNESFRRQYTKVVEWDHQFSKKIGMLGRAIYKQDLQHPSIQTKKLVDIVTRLGALTQTAGTHLMSRPHSLQMGSWDPKVKKTFFTEQNDAFVNAVNAMRNGIASTVPSSFEPMGVAKEAILTYQNTISHQLEALGLSLNRQPSAEWAKKALLYALKNNQIPKFADGGVVKKGTLAVVGEAGPEVILPLKDIPEYANGTGNGYISGKKKYTFSKRYGFAKYVKGQPEAYRGMIQNPIEYDVIPAKNKNILKKTTEVTNAVVQQALDELVKMRSLMGSAVSEVRELAKESPTAAGALKERLDYISGFLKSMKDVKDFDSMELALRGKGGKQILNNLLGTVYNDTGTGLTTAMSSLAQELESLSHSVQAMRESITDFDGKPFELNTLSDKEVNLAMIRLQKTFEKGTIDNTLDYDSFAHELVEKGFAPSLADAWGLINKGLMDMERKRIAREEKATYRKQQDDAIAKLLEHGPTDPTIGGARSNITEIGRWEDPSGKYDPKTRWERAMARDARILSPTKNEWETLFGGEIPEDSRVYGPGRKEYKYGKKYRFKNALASKFTDLLPSDPEHAKGLTGKVTSLIGKKASSLMAGGKMAAGAALGTIALGVTGIVALLNKLVKASPVLQGVLDLFNLAVNMLLMPLGNAIGEKMLPAVLEMVTWAVDVGGPALASLVDFGQNLWNWFCGDQIGAIIDAVNFFKNGDWLGGLGKLWEALMDGNPLLHAIKDGLFWLKDKVFDPMWNWLSNPVENIFKPMGQAIKSVFEGIGDVGGNIVDGVKGFLGLASGGLVMGTPFGTPAIIGEGGQSELIVPLDEVQETFNGGKGITIVFQGPVYGMNDFKRTVTDIASEAINSARYR